MSSNQGTTGDPRRVLHLVSFRERTDDDGAHHLEVFLQHSRSSGLLELPGRLGSRRHPRIERMALALTGGQIEPNNPYPRQVAVLYDEHARQSGEGFAVHDVFAVKFKTEPTQGVWVDLMDIPASIDPRHRPMIDAALRVFTREAHRIVALAYWGVATAKDAAGWQQAVDFDCDYLGAWDRPDYREEVLAEWEFYYPHRFWQESIRRLVVFWSMQFATTAP